VRVRVVEVTAAWSRYMWLCDPCGKQVAAEPDVTSMRWGREIKQPCQVCHVVGETEQPYCPPVRKPQPEAPPVAPRPTAARAPLPHARRSAGADPTMKRFTELRAQGLTREQAFEAIDREQKGA